MQPKAKIVTSCWLTTLPAGYAPIGISRGVPRRRTGYRRCAALQPGPWLSSTGLEEFTKLYNDEILGVLDPELVVKQLLEIADGRTPALLCWEPPEPGPKWCHRSLVSIWLYEKTGLIVPEYGLENKGYAWSHPKLHPDVRRR
jgi:hypothetical protein